MQVTLRKAHLLAQALIEAAHQIKAKSSERLSIYDGNAEQTLSKLSVEFEQNITVARDLITSAYSIRRALAAANARTGVDDLLVEREVCNAHEKLISAAVGSGLRMSKAQLNGEMAALLKGLENGYGNNYVTTSALTEEFKAKLAEDFQAIRRQKTRISDRLMEINMQNKIEIDSATEGRLRTLGLID